MLGYPLNRQGKKLGWHKLKVEVLRHGIDVRARNTFLLTDTRQSSSEEQRSLMISALQSPVDFTAIPIQGRWTEVSPGELKHKKIGFELILPKGFAELDVDHGNHMHVEFAVQAAAAGKTEPVISTRTVDVRLDPRGLEQVQQHGLTYRSALSLLSGEHVVRFVVLDALSGRIGSVAAPLKVQ